MINIKQKGNFEKTSKFLNKSRKAVTNPDLDKYGMMGVQALRETTPKDTGKTADSWSYRIEQKNGQIALQFLNSNINQDVPIAVIIQYGHATGTGGWVEGVDYINPAIRPLFYEIIDNVWKEVNK